VINIFIILVLWVFSGGAFAQDAPVPVPESAATVDDDSFSRVMAIVYRNSEVLLGKQNAMGIRSGASNWNGQLRLIGGYADKSTQDFASGLDGRAVVSFEYPLTGEKSVQSDLDRAKAMADLYAARDSLAGEVLVELQKIHLLRIDFDAVNNEHQLNMDILEQVKKANAQALAAKREFEQRDITPYLDKAMQSNSSIVKADALFRTQVEVVARSYGGKEWKELLGAIRNYLGEIGKWK